MGQVVKTDEGRPIANRVVIFDRAFFVHCTMGDRALMVEIIGLFQSQIETSLASIMDVSSSKDWKFFAHTLKGAAAAVGAGEIEMLASSWEVRPMPKRYSEREALAETLRQASQHYFSEANKALVY
jgi:HPt (histidine-containing phosphotransfer) domain-containing protein